uniref:26S proteasome complex subunit SEM1 n=1 Tax=Dromaius novaehollandiae TaxID=8790 RepID=A0A8C4IX16_DRONO
MPLSICLCFCITDMFLALIHRLSMSDLNGLRIFVCFDWTGLDEDEDAHVWEDNWDDDNVEDDFSNQLRAELEKHGYKMETS